MMVDATSQKREVVAHPIRHAKAQHVTIEARYRLNVGDMKCNMSQFVRDYSVSTERLILRFRTLEDLHHRPLEIFKSHHGTDGRLRIRFACRTDTVVVHLTLELVEAVVGTNLKSQPHAPRLQTF